MSLYLGNKKVAPAVYIKEGETFGIPIEMFIGFKDENGVLQRSTDYFNITFQNIETIGYNCFNGLFRNFLINQISFGSIKEIQDYGFYAAFDGNSYLSSVEMPNVEKIGDYGLFSCFYQCRFQNIDFPKLKYIGAHGLDGCFTRCFNLVSVGFSALEEIQDRGLYNAFPNCTGITKISFPSLIKVVDFSLYNAFNGCTNLTEIHFRSDMQETISALTGYADKWGATNATIYFDL